MSKDKINKPILLKAVETILADPRAIRKKALNTLEKCSAASSKKETVAGVREKAAKQIVRHYSDLAAIAGGATAAVSVFPGVGTIMAATGGAMSDAALCMKFQLEMTWELATIYGRNIDVEEENNLCYLLAGFGALSEIAKQGGTRVGIAAMANLSRPYLRNAAISGVKMIFRRLGIVFARKALQKAIPFGVGVGVSILANKALTHYVGREVQTFFASNSSSAQTDINPEIIDVEFSEVS